MGVGQQRDCDPTDYSPKQTCCFLGLVLCRILQINFLQQCQGLHCLFTKSLGVTQNYPEGCTVLHFFVIRTLCNFTRKWNYWTCSDKLQNGACHSQAQWLRVDKPPNSPLFGAIDQKKLWKKSTETKSEVHTPMSTNQVKGFVKLSIEYLPFNDLMVH